MEEMWKNSAIITKRNVDDNEDPISIQLSEFKQVMDIHSCIVLNQLPDTQQGIYIEGFTEVFDIEKTSSKNYKVDYANGVIYFNPVNIGKTLTVEYAGIGYCLLSTSRIYTKYDKNGNVLETLEELLDKGKLYIEAIETLGGAVTVINKLKQDIVEGNELHNELVEDISVGTQVKDALVTKTEIANTTINNLVEKTNTGNQTVTQLIDKNNIATQKKQALDSSITQATNTNEVLTNTNESATQTNLTLQQTIATGQDSVNKINSTGNKSLIVGASSFVDNEYTWTHSMNNDNLIVSLIDSDTNEPLMHDYKIIDKNNILIRNSAEHPNIKVVLSAGYYNGNTAIGTTMEEFNGDTFTEGMQQVRLKDNQTNTYQMPVTNSDAVYMADGSTRLTKKISDIETDLTEKALKTDLYLKTNDTDNTRTTTSKTVTGAINELNASIGGINTSVGGINTSLNAKQNSSDATLTTTNKTISGAINELVTKSNAIESKLPLATSYVPTLGGGLSAYDDTVVNLMTVSKEGFVTYNFCVTGGKSNNNIANGAILCYIPTGVPVSKISYDVVNIETASGLRRLAMAIINPSNRSIVLYFIGEETAVSSAKGTVKWYVATP